MKGMDTSLNALKMIKVMTLGLDEESVLTPNILGKNVKRQGIVSLPFILVFKDICYKSSLLTSLKMLIYQ